MIRWQSFQKMFESSACNLLPQREMISASLQWKCHRPCPSFIGPIQADEALFFLMVWKPFLVTPIHWFMLANVQQASMNISECAIFFEWRNSMTHRYLHLRLFANLLFGWYLEQGKWNDGSFGETLNPVVALPNSCTDIIYLYDKGSSIFKRWVWDFVN